MSARPDLEVVHCDNHLLVVAKPAGVPVAPDDSGDESLLERAKAWVKREFEKPGRVYLGLVHRLDRPVSGVVVFARTSKAAARLSEQFREGRVHKVYRGLVVGRPRGKSGELEQWLRKDAQRNRVEVVAPATRDAKPARTRWRVLRELGGRTLLELEPLTGRSHQLRLAAAKGLGCPLLGDVKYGAPQPLADRSVALHARLLEVDHPTLRARVTLCCPPPAEPWWRAWGPAARG